MGVGGWLGKDISNTTSAPLCDFGIASLMWFHHPFSVSIVSVQVFLSIYQEGAAAKIFVGLVFPQHIYSL